MLFPCLVAISLRQRLASTLCRILLWSSNFLFKKNTLVYSIQNEQHYAIKQQHRIRISAPPAVTEFVLKESLSRKVGQFDDAPEVGGGDVGGRCGHEHVAAGVGRVAAGVVLQPQTVVGKQRRRRDDSALGEQQVVAVVQPPSGHTACQRRFVAHQRVAASLRILVVQLNHTTRQSHINTYTHHNRRRRRVLWNVSSTSMALAAYRDRERERFHFVRLGNSPSILVALTQQ